MSCFVIPLISHAGEIVLSGWGTAVIDGQISQNEWDENSFAVFSVNTPEGGIADGIVHAMNDEDILYLAVIFDHTANGNTASIQFDNNNDGSETQPGDDVILINPNPTVGFWDEYRYTGPPCPSGKICAQLDTDDGGTNDGSGVFYNSELENVTIYEFSHPLNSSDNDHDFSLDIGDTVGFQLHIRMITGSTADTFFPSGMGEIIISDIPENYISPGIGMIAEPQEGISITFDEVIFGGICSVESGTGDAPPADFIIVSPTYEINFTGSYTGQAEVCFDYEENLLVGGEQDISLMHRQNSGASWQDITTFVDTDNDIICGEVTSFSEFAIVEPQAASDSGGGGGGGGCFIATAAYGSYLHHHVSTLRRFRDEYLLTNRLGTRFVQAYYKYSPPFADYVAEHDGLRYAVRIGLAPLVGYSWLAMHYGLAITLSVLMTIIALAIGGTCYLFRAR